MEKGMRMASRRSVAGGVLAIAALGLLLAGPAAALTLPPSQKGIAVYDLAHVWQPATIAQAESIANAIRARTQAEVAVVSIPTGLSDVSTSTAQADALLIMQTWGVGRPGIDDGLVVLFDLDTTLRHGQIYLYTGKGFRDLYLSDDEARSIVDDVMRPTAKDGDFDGALLQGLARVDHVTQPNGNPDRAGTALWHGLVIGAIVAVALAVLALFLRTWWLRGRDARIPTIDDSVLLPAPPPGLTPALATVLRRDQVDHESFTSALVDLGHRGLLTFEEGGLIKKHVSLLVPMAPLEDPASSDARRRPLGNAEATLLGEVNAAATGGLLSSTDLQKGVGKKLFDAFKTTIGEAALASGWFRDDPTKITSRWTGIGIGLAIVAAALAFFFVIDRSEGSNLVLPGRAYIGWPLLLASIIGVLITIFSRYLAARTIDGAQTLAMALAYRNTL
ncbi:MAG TPA: TPM domain-containing protein, partial [Candidatus Limnocylindrales bacterium]|nr:TPM domain-containing protein [Candidatus Limnocylindrales bacterium]